MVDSSAPAARPDLYTVGGTVWSDNPAYVTRAADDELFAYCQARELAYILSSRQMGKSSLMVRTAERLRNLDGTGPRSAFIDLQEIGVKSVTDQTWYAGIIEKLSDDLQLEARPMAWWQAHEHLGLSQRFARFLREVVLEEIAEPVVLFFDEIDSTLSLQVTHGRGFTDDFFTAIRGLYNARANTPSLRRLSFVLAGVATPGDLIQDSVRTPFNVGKRVELTDFTFKEARPLADGLGPSSEAEAEQVLGWVLKWTGGHPYLTQRLCRALADEYRETWTEDEVDEIVGRLFFAENAAPDTHLQFVRNMLTTGAAEPAVVLTTYRDVAVRVRLIPDDARSSIVTHLKLAGVVRVERGTLHVRNRIYETVFDVRWLDEVLAVFAPSGSFTVGGTVQLGLGMYLARQADDDLLTLCRSGTFAYLLGPPQLGKSSLLIRTAERLAAEGVRSVAVDLSEIGTNVTADSWYLGFIFALGDRLLLGANPQQWWQAHSHLGAPQRLVLFLEEMVMARIGERLVIFLDEIDMLLGLPFAGDVFAAIGTIYDSRSRVPDFRRLSFVMAGTVPLSDLGQHVTRMPFTAGRRVDLGDYTPDEARPLAAGLGLASEAEAEQVLGWVLKWTGGHPYLTQRLCRALADEHRATWTEDQVDALVGRVFLGHMAEQDSNLAFVRRMLTRHTLDDTVVLTTYREIWRGRRPVPDDEQSWVKAELKFSGAVRSEDGLLRVRNRIYREVFNDTWIGENLPVNWARRAAQAAIAACILLLVISLPLAIFAFVQWQRAAEALTISDESRAQAQVAATLAVAAQATAEAERASAEQARATAVQAGSEADAQRASAVASTDAANRANEQTQISLKAAEEARKVAEAQQGIALARQLAAQAEAMRSHRGDSLSTSVALAMEAMFRLPSSSSAEQPLRRGLALLARHARTLPHTSAVRAVSYSPDGQYLATADEDGVVKLWNPASEQPVQTFEHPAPVRDVAFSPDGRFLATGSDKVRIWEIGPDAPAREIAQVQASAVAFNHDGTLLAAGGEDRTARIWRLSLTPVQQIFIQTNDQAVNDVAFSRDGTRLATAGADFLVRVWEIDKPQQPPMELHHDDGVRAVAFSEDGAVLASASQDHHVRIWDASSGRELRRVTQEASANDVKFSPDGRYLASGSDDRTVRIWEVSNGREVKRMAHGHSVQGVAFSPDGRLLASASNDRTAQIWDVGPDQDLVRLPHGGTVTSVSFRHDGLVLATGSWDHWIRLWDPFSGQEIMKWQQPSEVDDVKFSPDGRYLASGGRDNVARIWAMPGGELVHSLVHDGSVGALSFSADSSRLATGNHDKTARLWDFESETELRRFPHDSAPLSVALSPDGKLLATGNDQGLWVWDTTADTMPPVPVHHRPGAVRQLAYSPRGRYLAVVLDEGDGPLRILDPTGKTDLLSVAHVGNRFQSVAFSDDDRFLAAGAWDFTARVWTLPGMDEAAIVVHDDWVDDVAFSPDGRFLATASFDKTARISLLTRMELVDLACQRLTQKPTPDDWGRYLDGGTPSVPCFKEP